MLRSIAREFLKSLIPKEKIILGRWNSQNPEIKATIANMDCCGDSLCGKPENYNEAITDLIKKKTNP